MKISIITPSYNQGNFIEDTIKSVIQQDYPNFEHIIIDGGSTDNTLDILKRYPHLRWISEKDSGQSEAINKGFKLATGDIIAWLNSDDYYERNIFSLVANYFQENSQCRILYGDMTFVDYSGNAMFILTGDTISREKLIKCPDAIRQPSIFWKKEVIDESMNNE